MRQISPATLKGPKQVAVIMTAHTEKLQWCSWFIFHDGHLLSQAVKFLRCDMRTHAHTHTHTHTQQGKKHSKKVIKELKIPLSMQTFSVMPHYTEPLLLLLSLKTAATALWENWCASEMEVWWDTQTHTVHTHTLTHPLFSPWDESS